MASPTKSLLCTAALLFCVVIATFPGAEGCGGFVQTCTNFQIDPIAAIFITDCSCGTNCNDHNEMSLGGYIGNDNGVLVLGADFLASCQDLSWYGVPSNDALYIKANCKDDSGNLQFADFDVNQRAPHFQWWNSFMGILLTTFSPRA